MAEKGVEDILQACQNEYEQKMLGNWDGIKSLEELTELHNRIKSETITFYEATWRGNQSDTIPPEDVEEKLANKIDQIFELSKAHFTSPTKLSPAANFPLSNSEEYAIGIDMGTTMCCIAVVYQGKVEVVPNRTQNSRTTPSYVCFHSDGNDTFGHVAKTRAFKYPESTIYDTKRMIGRPWNDVQLQKDKLNWPFEIIEENGNPKIKIGDRTRYPHEISARLLTRFRIMAEEFLHLPRGTIRKAVITVPAYFSEPQRRATKEAGICAGLEVLNILSEPTAAAIAYSCDRRAKGNRKVLIYDLGGGTFDVSIGIVKHTDVEILCVSGDNHLGGEDFDQLLMEYCVKAFEEENGINLLEGRNSEDLRVKNEVLRCMARLRAECQKAKEWLADAETVTIDIPSIKNGLDLSIEISRKILDALCEPLVEKTLEIVQKTVEDAKTKGINGKEDIDDVILIGGSTKMVLVMEMVQSYFQGKQLCKHINPDEAVAKGAALQGNMILKQEQGRFDDVTPFTLGIECLQDIFKPMIPRNTKLPFDVEEIFNTSEDYQKAMRITVLQGESGKASENLKLGEFYFQGIPEAMAGQERVKVTMTINGMGILQVRAISLSSGMENEITVTSDQLGMNANEIEELSKELEQVSLRTNNTSRASILI